MRKKYIKTIVFIILTIMITLAFYNNDKKITKYLASARTEENLLLTTIAAKLIDFIGENKYLLSSKDIPSDDIFLIRLANEITYNKKTDVEKSKAIYAWITTNIVYDIEKANKRKYISPNNWEYESVYEVLENKKAMCMGYTRLNITLHRAIGIPAKGIYGKNHAWNEIYLKDKWQIQDTTYGSGYIDLKTNVFVPHYDERYFSSSKELWYGNYLW